ncbi:MAG: hypothetical protein IT162_03925 [Bryobacterales bacterium]|nr:hypothetical protein [Bryobacterales bacterium]
MPMEWQYYIDIRGTHKDAAKAAAWEASIRALLQKIAKTGSGQAVLNSLRFHARWVVIWPRDVTMEKCLLPTVDKLGKTKDGKGYAVEIYYSPGIWSPHGSCHKLHAPKGGGAGSKTDEILFHELVHAVRRSSGKRARVETSGGLDKYNSNEELFALLSTNIYCTDPSNKSGSGLRRDHKSFESLEAELSGSFEFFRVSTTAYSLIEAFCNDNPGLTGALAKVKSSFNPLAAYYSDKKKARENSQSATAMLRDATGWGKAMWEMVNPF